MVAEFMRMCSGCLEAVLQVSTASLNVNILSFI
jgi:hypothetical protein